jgi:hypothetical protein
VQAEYAAMARQAAPKHRSLTSHRTAWTSLGQTRFVEGGAEFFSMPSMQREPNGAVCIAPPSATQEIKMNDSENHHQSSDQHQKDAPAAEGKDPDRQLPDDEASKAADTSSIPADEDDTIEAELEGRNSSNGNEVA